MQNSDNNDKGEWSQYAKMLFNTSDSHKELALYTIDEEIVCSPSPNTTFRDTTGVKSELRESNAFDDFIKQACKENKQNEGNGNSSRRFFDGNSDRKGEEVQKQQEEEQDEEQICESLLKEFYNQRYIDQGLQSSMLEATFKKRKQVVIKSPFIFSKPSLSTASSSKKQNITQNYNSYFCKDDKCVYIIKQNSFQIIFKHSLSNIDQYSKTISTDSNNNFFLFNNTSQEIEIISFKTGKTICKLKSYVDRLNPDLYFHQETKTLFLIGGYEMKDMKLSVLDKVEIYKIQQNGIQFEPIIIKISKNRLRPIISQCKVDNRNYLLIIGGVTNASLVRSNLILDQNSVQNVQCNMTADIVEIDSFNISPISIKSSTLKLFSGLTIFHNKQILTILQSQPHPLKFNLSFLSNSKPLLSFQFAYDCDLDSLKNQIFIKQPKSESEVILLSPHQQSITKTEIQINRKSKYQNKKEKICCPII